MGKLQSLRVDSCNTAGSDKSRRFRQGGRAHAPLLKGTIANRSKIETKLISAASPGRGGGDQSSKARNAKENAICVRWSLGAAEGCFSPGWITASGGTCAPLCTAQLLPGPLPYSVLRLQLFSFLEAFSPVSTDWEGHGLRCT